MKFDFCIGNPPYQEGDGSGGSSDSAIPMYNKFFSVAKKISSNGISMIFPSKWMVGGRGLDNFRNEMVNDTRIKTIFDFENSNDVFSGVHLDGGVCCVLWDANYDGETKFIYKPANGTIIESKRYLKNHISNYVIRDNRILTILEKCHKKRKFSSIVSSVRPYGIRGYLFNNPERYPDSNLSNVKFPNSVHIYGVKGIKGGAKRTDGYISPCIIKNNKDSIDKYKIFFTTSYSTNAFIPPSTILGKPGEICTETFLLIGPFENEKEQKNCEKYIETDFFRFLLFCGKGTMHVTSAVFEYIPLLSFADNSDIDWNGNINEITQSLYKKFNINAEEVSFINKYAKEMV